MTINIVPIVKLALIGSCVATFLCITINMAQVMPKLSNGQKAVANYSEEIQQPHLTTYTKSRWVHALFWTFFVITAIIGCFSALREYVKLVLGFAVLTCLSWFLRVVLVVSGFDVTYDLIEPLRKAGDHYIYNKNSEIAGLFFYGLSTLLAFAAAFVIKRKLDRLKV